MSEFDNFTFITPEQAVERGALDPCPGLEEYQRRAQSRKKCEVCEQPVWKIVDTDLCFTCTTGEAGADEDYELA